MQIAMPNSFAKSEKAETNAARGLMTAAVIES